MRVERPTWIKAIGLLGVGIMIGWAMPGQQESVAKDGKKASPVRIGYVNMPKVLREYQRANAEGAKITEAKRADADRLDRRQGELNQLDQKAEAAKDPEQRQLLKAKADEARKAFEESDREVQRKLTDRSNAVILEVYEQIRIIAEEVAKDRGFDVIEAFPSASKPEEYKSPQVAQLMLQSPGLIPIYLRPEFDVSADVIERLNKKFP